jgi:hypothetical protein
LACREKPHPLTSALAKGNALLYRSRHRAGQFGVLVIGGVVTRGHHVLNARFEITPLAQVADVTRWLIFWSTTAISPSRGGS